MAEKDPLVRTKNESDWEDEDDDSRCVAKIKSRIGFLFSVTLTVLVIIGVIVAVIIGWLHKEPVDETMLLAQSVVADDCLNIYTHLEGLQAAAGNSSRAVMTNYAASAEYIETTLNDAGVDCEPVKQEFQTAIYTELESPVLIMTSPWYNEFQLTVDFAGMRYGGNGFYALENKTVCAIPNGGCNIEDFANVSNDCVALIEVLDSDDCSLISKSFTAQNANASAVILYNNRNRQNLLTARVRGAGWFPGDPLMDIPVLAGSYSLGNILTSGDARLTLISNTTIDIVITFNVFCTTKDGDPNSVIVVGAHLDSVPEGPGLNDNGSGSSTLLEIVLQWYALGLKPVNKIHFAWWGSEEVGLIGSRHFVRDLQDNNPAEFSKIAMNLNFDMLASPNYYLGVHDGSTAVAAQNASMVITTMFEEYFTILELDYNLISLTSGSDFVPFVEAGIPAGGLAAGAGSIKSEDGRTRFGGFANAPYDPCYHLYCDTVDNINYEALGYLAGAAAYVVQKSAQMHNLRHYLHNTTVADLDTHQVMGVVRPILKED